jgi:hypothetical protein
MRKMVWMEGRKEGREVEFEFEEDGLEKGRESEETTYMKKV